MLQQKCKTPSKDTTEIQSNFQKIKPVNLNKIHQNFNQIQSSSIWKDTEGLI